MTEVALGIDLGTGSTKAGLVDRAGRLLAVGRAAHPIDSPRQGWSETHPSRWWASTRRAVAAAMDEARGVEVACVGLSGQMHGVVLCDGDGVATRPAVLWPDRRARARLGRLRDRLDIHGEALANPLTPGMAGPILHVLAHTEAAAVERAAWALAPKDWLRLRLTGTAATEPSDASATLLWSLPDDEWLDGALDAFDVPRRLLPPVLGCSGSAAGELGDDPASALGLSAGLPVAAGAGDTAAGLLGAGVAIGETQLSVGTGGQIAALLDVPTVDQARRTHLYRAADVDDRPSWYAMAATQNAGLAVDWALRVLGASYEEASTAVGAAAVGAGGVCFLPYLTGERTPHIDSTLRGTWTGLHEGTRREHLLRSVFEGVAFALRDGLDALRDVGHDIETLLLAGGGTHQAWWRQMLADVLGVPLVPHDATDASVRGAAVLGWAAADHRVDPASGVARAGAVEPGGTEYGAALEAFRSGVDRPR